MEDPIRDRSPGTACVPAFACVRYDRHQGRHRVARRRSGLRAVHALHTGTHPPHLAAVRTDPAIAAAQQPSQPQTLIPATPRNPNSGGLSATRRAAAAAGCARSRAGRAGIVEVAYSHRPRELCGLHRDVEKAGRLMRGGPHAWLLGFASLGWGSGFFFFIFKKKLKFQKYMSVLENFKNIPRSPYGGRQGSNVNFFL